MSDRSTASADERTAQNPVVWGAVSALGTLLASLAIVVALALLSWATDTPAASSPWSAARVALQSWYLAHGVTLPASWGPVSVPPLLLTGVIVLLLYRSGRSAVRACGVRTWKTVLECTCAMTISYATAAILISSIAYPRPPLLSIRDIAVGTAVICAIPAAAGMLRESGLGSRLLRSLPGPSYAYVRGASATLRTLGALSALVVACSLVISFSEASALTAALSPAGLGGLTIVVIAIGYLPNAMLLAVALGTGAGFTLGGDSHYSLGTVRDDQLPSFPLFAALPDHPGLLVVLVAMVPVGAAVVGALTLTRHLEREDRTAATLLGGTVASAVMTCAVVLAVAVLARGGLGDGRLRVVGVPPLRLAVWLFGVLVVVGAVTGLIATARALTPAGVSKRRKALAVLETTQELEASEGEEVAEVEPDHTGRPVITSRLAMRRLARSGRFAAAALTQASQSSEEVRAARSEPPARAPSATLSVVKRARQQRALTEVAGESRTKVAASAGRPSGAGASAVRRS